MIDVQTAERIHNLLIDRFGGSTGVRDYNGLESALARPFSTFDGNELYTTPVDKGAALFESLIIAHPFVDGNKRIAYVLLRLLLSGYNHDIVATQDEKYDFVIAASTGSIRFEEIRDWLTKHILIKP